MKLRALRLYNVGCFGGRGIAIDNINDGVNVLCAANETGKSTSFEALHALFFLPHSSMRKDVQNLRPYSGGNPLIEVDITTKQGKFRISKQYCGKNFAKVQDLQRQKLLAQADEAENFIAQLVKGDVGSPTGLLWVRQGVNALEKQSNAQESYEQLARTGLLESVQGEVDAVTGGRRMHAIMKQVTTELDSLITTRGAKARSRYAIVCEEVEHLTLEEQRLEAEVRALRQALDERTKVQKKLAEHDDEQAHLERQLDRQAAQKEVDDAKLQQEKINSAAAQCKLAQQNHDIAKQNLANFHQALQQQLDIEPQLQQLKCRKKTILADRRTASIEFEQILAARKKLEINIERQQQYLQQAQAVSQLAEIEQQLMQLRQTEEAYQQTRLARNLIKMTPEIWHDLQNLDIEIARLQAIAAAKRPSFTIHYNPHAKEHISFDEVEITQDGEYFYQDGTRLVIPHLATITLQTNLTVETNTDLDKKQKHYQQLQKKYHIKTLAQAREQLDEAQALDARLASLHLSIQQFAPQGLAELQARQAELQSICDKYAQAPIQETTKLGSLLTQGRAQLDEVQNALQSLQTQRIAQEQEFSEIEGQLAVLETQLAHSRTLTGVQHQQDEHQRCLEQKFKKTQADLAAATARLETLQTGIVDFDAAQIRLNRLQSVEMAIRKENSHLRETLANLNGIITTHSDQAVEEKWFEVKERLEAARVRLGAEEANLAALQRLYAALDKARKEARDFYLRPVMDELTPLLKLIFDDITIHFDDKTLSPQRIERDGQKEDIERLSGGMREQISILTRLAFARLLARSGRQIPVILDDALVYCDDERIEKMFDVLHVQAQEQQIIVFSCRSRAFSRLGGHVLHMRDWQP